MKSIKVVAIIALAGVFAAGSAFAEKEGKKEGKRPGGPGEKGERRGPPGGPGGFLKMMDKDGDGTITRAEFDAAQAKRAEHMKERLGDKFDADKAADRANEMFAKLDADGSGSVSKEEAAKAREHFAKRRGPGKPGEGRRPGKPGEGKGPGKNKDKGDKGGE